MDSEKHLLEAAKCKDKQALAALYNANFRWLYRFIRSRVSSNEVAEDICAEAFTRAFERLDSFRGDSSFKTWLYAISKNELFKWYRTRSDNVSLNEEIATQDASTYHSSIQVAEVVRNILGAIKDRYREVLELRFLSRLSVKETAELMQLTENNVKVLQNRALKQAQLRVSQLNIKPQ